MNWRNQPLRSAPGGPQPRLDQPPPASVGRLFGPGFLIVPGFSLQSHSSRTPLFVRLSVHAASVVLSFAASNAAPVAAPATFRARRPRSSAAVLRSVDDSLSR